MMYIHYCKHCDRIHMLSGHKFNCPACADTLTELPLSFLEYENMDEAARRKLKETCRTSSQTSASGFRP